MMLSPSIREKTSNWLRRYLSADRLKAAPSRTWGQFAQDTAGGPERLAESIGFAAVPVLTAGVGLAALRSLAPKNNGPARAPASPSMYPTY